MIMLQSTPAQTDNYSHDQLGEITTPYPQRFDENKPSLYDPDRYLLESASAEQKVVKIGTVLVRGASIQYLPLIQPHMEVGWWELTGNVGELVGKVKEGIPTYCKLKGIHTQSTLLPKNGPMITADRITFNKLEIHEVVWVKSRDEIITIRENIMGLIDKADGHYRNRDCSSAFPLYNQAKNLAQEYLPNTISYAVLKRIKECEDFYYLGIGRTAFDESEDYTRFLVRLASDSNYMAIGLNYELNKVADVSYYKVKIYDLLVHTLIGLSERDKSEVEQLLLTRLLEDLEEVTQLPAQLQMLELYENMLQPFCSNQTMKQLEDLRNQIKNN
jgi:hypothetical protein